MQQKKILCHFERSFVSGKKRQNKVNIFMMIRNFACKFGVFCWANAIIDIKWKYLSFYFARGKLIFALNINQKNSKNFSKKRILIALHMLRMLYLFKISNKLEWVLKLHVSTFRDIYVLTINLYIIIIHFSQITAK